MNVAYSVVYDSIKNSIKKGDYPIGSILPSEPELEQMFRVSRTTIRKATDLLTQDGFIKPLRGIGTVVLDYRITQNLNKITSITESLKAKGYTVSLKEFSIQKEIPKSEVAAVLGLEKGQMIIHVKRVLCADDMYIALLENFIPYELVAGFENYNESNISLYKYLEEHYHIAFDMAQDSIFAVNANATIAKMLNVPVGFALLSIERKCLYNGKCICYDVNHLKSDVYKFGVTMYSR